MKNDLDTRMRKALGILRFECDYEDDHKGGSENFIRRNVLAPGIGDKTISRLLEKKLIIEGPHRWSKDTGYRITTAGREALE